MVPSIKDTMYPDLIHLETIRGVVHIGAYFFFLWCAMTIMVTGLYRLSRSQKYSPWQAVGMSLGVMTLALIGARLMNIFTNASAYQKYPAQVYSLDLHGLSIFGGITLVGLFIFFVGFVKRVPQWKKSDFLVPYAGISIIVARIGCFLGGCCFGVVTRLPWGVRFPMLSDAHLYQVTHGQTDILTSLPVHPTQLYEAIGTLIAVTIAVMIKKKKWYENGDSITVFIGMYFFTRFVTHFFRAYPDTFSSAPFFSFLYGAIILSCLGYMRFRKQVVLPMKKRRKNR